MTDVVTIYLGNLKAFILEGVTVNLSSILSNKNNSLNLVEYDQIMLRISSNIGLTHVATANVLHKEQLHPFHDRGVPNLLQNRFLWIRSAKTQTWSSTWSWMKKSCRFFEFNSQNYLTILQLILFSLPDVPLNVWYHWLYYKMVSLIPTPLQYKIICIMYFSTEEINIDSRQEALI